MLHIGSLRAGADLRWGVPESMPTRSSPWPIDRGLHQQRQCRRNRSIACALRPNRPLKAALPVAAWYLLQRAGSVCHRCATVAELRRGSVAVELPLRQGSTQARCVDYLVSL